jgi:hypothetical protein
MDMQSDVSVFKAFFEEHCTNEAGSWVDLGVLQNAFFWYCKLNKKDDLVLQRVWCTGSHVKKLAEQHGGEIRQSLGCCIIKGVKILRYP